MKKAIITFAVMASLAAPSFAGTYTYGEIVTKVENFLAKLEPMNQNLSDEEQETARRGCGLIVVKNQNGRSVISASKYMPTDDPYLNKNPQHQFPSFEYFGTGPTKDGTEIIAYGALRPQFDNSEVIASQVSLRITNNKRNLFIKRVSPQEIGTITTEYTVRLNENLTKIEFYSIVGYSSVLFLDFAKAEITCEILNGKTQAVDWTKKIPAY